MLDVAAPYLTSLLVTIYPMIKTLSLFDTLSEKESKQWLTYWVIFGVFTWIDHFDELILSWIPYYYAIKLSVLITMFHPEILGATILYDTYIKEMATNNDEIKQKAE